MDTLISNWHCPIPIFGPLGHGPAERRINSYDNFPPVLLLLCGLLPSNIREVLISGGAAPLLAFVVLAFSHPNSLGSRFLGSNLLFEAGAVSYITYILQAPVWHISRLAMGGTRSATERTPQPIGS